MKHLSHCFPPLVAVLVTALVLTSACQLGTTGLEPIARSGDPLPDDVDPESFSRMPLVDVTALDEEGQQVASLTGAGDAANPLRGPEALALYSPSTARSLHELDQHLSGESALGSRYVEVAALVAAREMDQAYQWAVHEPLARQAGIPENIIEVIKNDLDIVAMEPPDANIIRMGRQLFRQHRATPDVWARAVEYFGAQGAVELTAVLGQGAMTALMLHAVDQQMVPGQEATLPARPDYIRE